MAESDSALVDDMTIVDAAQLWRRIPPLHFVRDENTGRMRPSSAAFCDDGDGGHMSVVLGDYVLAAGRDFTSALAGHLDFGLVTISAGIARSKEQGIIRQPTEEEPCHAEVFGKKTGSVRKTLAKASAWLIAPPGK